MPGDFLLPGSEVRYVGRRKADPELLLHILDDLLGLEGRVLRQEVPGVGDGPGTVDPETLPDFPDDAGLPKSYRDRPRLLEQAAPGSRSFTSILPGRTRAEAGRRVRPRIPSKRSSATLNVTTRCSRTRNKADAVRHSSSPPGTHARHERRELQFERAKEPRFSPFRLLPRTSP